MTAQTPHAPCPYCGKPSPEAADVCEWCGKTLPPLPHLRTFTKTPKAKILRSRLFLLASAIFGVLAVALIIYGIAESANAPRSGAMTVGSGVITLALSLVIGWAAFEVRREVTPDEPKAP